MQADKPSDTVTLLDLPDDLLRFILLAAPAARRGVVVRYLCRFDAL
jgi:hypothetical protein